MLRDGDEDFIVEVDEVPAAEDELVDDGREKLEVDVFAVEDAGFVRERVLGGVLDEGFLHLRMVAAISYYHLFS